MLSATLSLKTRPEGPRHAMVMLSCYPLCYGHAILLSAMLSLKSPAPRADAISSCYHAIRYAIAKKPRPGPTPCYIHRYAMLTLKNISNAMRFQNLLMLRYHILWYTVTKPNHQRYATSTPLCPFSSTPFPYYYNLFLCYIFSIRLFHDTLHHKPTINTSFLFKNSRNL
jgi:hypothetical protein